MADEKDLLLKARAGDQGAFGALVSAFQKPVYNLAYRMLGSEGEAEEATQETFLRVYRRLATYDAQQKVVSWILAIAAHYCIDCLRRRKTVQVPLEDLPPTIEADTADEGPEDGLVRREREQEVQALLDRLPEGYRLVLALRYWQDLSYEEMAQVLDITVSAVKARLHRARELMAAHLAPAPECGSTTMGPALSVEDRRGSAEPAPSKFSLERSVAGHALS